MHFTKAICAYLNKKSFVHLKLLKKRKLMILKIYLFCEKPIFLGLLALVYIYITMLKLYDIFSILDL